MQWDSDWAPRVWWSDPASGRPAQKYLPVPYWGKPCYYAMHNCLLWVLRYILSFKGRFLFLISYFFFADWPGQGGAAQSPRLLGAASSPLPFSSRRPLNPLLLLCAAVALPSPSLPSATPPAPISQHVNYLWQTWDSVTPTPPYATRGQTRSHKDTPLQLHTTSGTIGDDPPTHFLLPFPPSFFNFPFLGLVPQHGGTVSCNFFVLYYKVFQ